MQRYGGPFGQGNETIPNATVPQCGESVPQFRFTLGETDRAVDLPVKCGTEAIGYLNSGRQTRVRRGWNGHRGRLCFPARQQGESPGILQILRIHPVGIRAADQQVGDTIAVDILAGAIPKHTHQFVVGAQEGDVGLVPIAYQVAAVGPPRTGAGAQIDVYPTIRVLGQQAIGGWVATGEGAGKEQRRADG